MNIAKLIGHRQYFSCFDSRVQQKELLSSAVEARPFHCHRQLSCEGTVNFLDLDNAEDKFLLAGFSTGEVTINEVLPCDYRLNSMAKVSFESSVNHCQWYPVDTGLFSATCSNSMTLVDSNSLTKIDSIAFKDEVFFSSWNSSDPTTIAVACSRSVIRIVDIRTGTSIQQIVVSSLAGTTYHNITRVCWSPLDEDFFVAGDSSGFLHAYDVRRMNKSLLAFRTEFNCPITCICFTPDKMSLITCHGVKNKINLWNFKSKSIVNSNINFQCLSGARDSKKNKNQKAALITRCQLHATNTHIFAPNSGLSNSDISVFEISSGIRIQDLSNKDNFYSGNVNCVAGTAHYPILFSGANKRLGIWCPLMVVDEKDQLLKKYHCDNWSDSD